MMKTAHKFLQLTWLTAPLFEELEEIEKALIFVYCTAGFYKNTMTFMKKNGMAWCEDGRLLNGSGSAASKKAMAD